MATYKPAAHIADIRGHVQNAVYSRNRLGNYIKLRKAPMDRRTAPQLLRRVRMFDAVAYWQDTLGAAHRALWNSLGLLTTWFNKAGIEYHPSGFNLFIRSYIFGFDVGLGWTDDPPTAAAATAPTFTFHAHSGANTELYVTADAGWCGAKDGYCRFSYSNPYPPTIYYPRPVIANTGWNQISGLVASFPRNIQTLGPSATGDHVTLQAQAYWLDGAGNTTTWPQTVIVEITAP